MQSSPSEIPSPAFAPSRQRSPIEITAVPPPDSVPMIDAPPPTSEPSPTTTPDEMRPSTIEAPSVPALKFTNPSCITVVPVGEVGAEADAVGVGDPHARRRDVVGHARELVDRRDRERDAGAAVAQPHRGQRAGVDRAVARPGDVAQHAEQAGEVGLVRADQPVREQVQAQVGVVRVRRRVGERADRGEHHDRAHAAALVAPGRGRQLVRPLVLPRARASRAVRERRRARAAARGTTCRARARRTRSAWPGRSPTRPLLSLRSSARTSYPFA